MSLKIFKYIDFSSKDIDIVKILVTCWRLLRNILAPVNFRKV